MELLNNSMIQQIIHLSPSFHVLFTYIWSITLKWRHLFFFTYIDVLLCKVCCVASYITRKLSRWHVKERKKEISCELFFFLVKRENLIPMSAKKILFVLTSHDKLLNGHPTGWYLPEVGFTTFDSTQNVYLTFRQRIHIMC